MHRWLAIGLVLALVAPAGATQARFATQMEWTNGTFQAGLFGAGESVFPEGIPAPDHERLDFGVSPCHRDLHVDLLYEPAGATANVADLAELTLPYRFRISLYEPGGERLIRYVVDEPDHGYLLPAVDAPGRYTLQLELLEGAGVHWAARVQGGGVEDPTCGLWLNEAETNPPGLDLTGEQVELYNEGEVPLTLDGWSLRAIQPNRTTSFPVPNGTTVPADGYALVDNTAQPIDDDNATLELMPPVGGNLDATPVLSDPRDNEGTHQRVPDGANDWRFREGTLGAANG